MTRYRPRSRRRRTRLDPHRDGGGWVYVADADEEIVLAEFGEAAWLALDLVQSELIQIEALVLLDERRRLSGVLCDVPPELALAAAVSGVHGMTPFRQAICVIVRDDIREAPPDPADLDKFRALRSLLAEHGVLLLDVILANADMIQSLSIAGESDPIWFEHFDPLPLDDTA